jgi:uncharacterized integral membrane protein
MTAETRDNSPQLVTGSAAQNDPSRPRTPAGPKWTAIPRSRLGGLWVGGIAFALLVLLLLIFVLQNGQPAEVSFFGAHGHLPMGVALLLAAVFGILLIALPGTARIVQLRILGRRPPAVARETSPMPATASPRSPSPSRPRATDPPSAGASANVPGRTGS